MTVLWKRVLAVAVLVGLVAAAWQGWSAYRTRRVPRVILLDASVRGLDPGCAAGVGRLLVDQMEVASGATVLVPGDPLSEGQLRALPEDDLLVRFSGHRDGTSLALGMVWIRAGDLGRGKAWDSFGTPLEAPGASFRRMAQGGPLPRRLPGASRLLPRDPTRFWELAAAVTLQEDVAAQANLDLSRQLAEAEPGSAAAWVNLGEHIYRTLWTEAAGGDLPQTQALDAFDRALALVPGYPRAALLKGLLLTDVGSQRAALRDLLGARALRPDLPDLYAGLAYAARTSGLLEGASRSVEARERLSRPFKLSSPWFAENSYLYSGRWDAFRDSLDGRRDPVSLFYRGYLDLLQGDRVAALEFFREGSSIKQTSVPFSDLCGVYAWALTGHPEQALATLNAFEEERGRLRIPDGELTFKVAEAYGFLGHPNKAIEAAGRAFAQGFGCLEWYEKSPLFAPARESPRWAALRQHLQERQRLMEQAFPASRFE